MNYNTLLDMATELGYQLAMSGAETFRVEESINRVLNAYGIAGEAFAIPNCLTVSLDTPDGKPMTRMRRIGYHGNDIDSVEKFSNLSRRICREIPDPQVAMDWIRNADSSRRAYPLWAYLTGHFLGASGFAILFGGDMLDCLCSGLCGLIIGIVNRYMDNQKANLLFRTLISSFIMAFVAYSMGHFNICRNPDAVIIGALMILVPGLLFTNAMRDVIYGDTNSGTNRIVQVFLIAAAIALGTGVAWQLIDSLKGTHVVPVPVLHPLWLECIATLVGCAGFAIIFNIHGPGVLFCASGGVLTWCTYRISLHLGCGDILAYFYATVIAAMYSEIMARVRKCPAIGYLVISAFPLIPGAGVYYTMNYAMQGQMSSFATQGTHTLAIASVMAVGILIASTCARLLTSIKHK